METRILKVVTGEFIGAEIKKPGKLKLPSIQEGWRFNFMRHSKDKAAHSFVLVALESPEEIEGCLVYKMRAHEEPYMAYIEIAPHNKGKNRKYDMVAGCLIAYACRLSFIMGSGDFKGWLAFDVHEPTVEDQNKLMGLYSTKYKAKRLADTSMMIIAPADGEKLVEEYLENFNKNEDNGSK